jgi:hypothetical protein
MILIFFQSSGRSFNPGFGEYYLGGGHPAALDSIAMESRNIEQVSISENYFPHNLHSWRHNMSHNLG